MCSFVLCLLIFLFSSLSSSSRNMGEFRFGGVCRSTHGKRICNFFSFSCNESLNIFFSCVGCVVFCPPFLSRCFNIGVPIYSSMHTKIDNDIIIFFHVDCCNTRWSIGSLHPRCVSDPLRLLFSIITSTHTVNFFSFISQKTFSFGHYNQSSPLFLSLDTSSLLQKGTRPPTTDLYSTERSPSPPCLS